MSWTNFWSVPMRALISSIESFRDWICPETWSIFPFWASCWVATCFCSVSSVTDILLTESALC